MVRIAAIFRRPLPTIHLARRKELLASAKERVAAREADMAGGSKANYHMLEGLKDDTSVRVLSSELPELPVLHVKDCHRCHIAVPADTSVVKLLVEGCSDCTFTVDGKITTDTVELWCAEGVSERGGDDAARAKRRERRGQCRRRETGFVTERETVQRAGKERRGGEPSRNSVYQALHLVRQRCEPTSPPCPPTGLQAHDPSSLEMRRGSCK
jgi:hypothetical protein